MKINITDMKINKQRKFKGFSLLELIMAMFISSLIIITVVAAFASAFRAQKKARDTQKNIEDAKASLELMAKIIRMSNNLWPSGSSSNIYMYNKSLDRCVSFQYSGNIISEYQCAPDSADENGPDGFCPPADNTPCAGGTSLQIVSNKTDITSNKLSDAAFDVSAGTIKRVTMRMKMNDSAVEASKTKLQTTVSLRDYKNLNPTGQ